MHALYMCPESYWEICNVRSDRFWMSNTFHVNATELSFHTPADALFFQQQIIIVGLVSVGSSLVCILFDSDGLIDKPGQEVCRSCLSCDVCCKWFMVLGEAMQQTISPCGLKQVWNRLHQAHAMPVQTWYSLSEPATIHTGFHPLARKMNLRVKLPMRSDLFNKERQPCVTPV